MARQVPLNRLRLGATTLAFALAGCVGTRSAVDPTVVLETAGGRELGVATDYGIVFLGRTARAGHVDIHAFYGDGLSIEHSVIEPVGASLYTAETEILLPSVRMSFIAPRPGSKLLVAGRTPGGAWEEWVSVRRDPRVYGILIDVPGPVRGRSDQVGAGVYWIPKRAGANERRLIGLVSGRILLEGESGTREYLTVLGPDELWRLVSHRRDHDMRRPWVYREDIL